MNALNFWVGRMPLLFAGLISLVAVGIVACDDVGDRSHSGESHEDHEVHDDHAEDENHDEHDEDRDHDRHGDEHDAHEEGGIIRLDEHQRASIDLIPATVRHGVLDEAFIIPGEIQWDADRVVHIAPRVSGIVLEIHKTLGDSVRPGDPLVTLDSAEIGQARMEFIDAQGRLEVLSSDLRRVEQVGANTRELLNVLDDGAAPDAALDQTRNLQIGEYKTRLMNAYTRLQVEQRNWAREQTLREKQINSESDYLEALGAHETARSDYQSLREEIEFDLEMKRVAARNERKTAESRLRNAERHLHILGLTQGQVDELRNHTAQPDESISRVSLHSSIEGVIVERHLSVGEQVDPSSALYKIADPDPVWFIGRVNEDNLRHVRPGMAASINLDAWPGESFEGTLDYVGHELDPESRTADVRVVIANPEGRLKAGLFGVVTILGANGSEGLLVPSGAVQRTVEGHVVFRIESEGVYESIPVLVMGEGRGLIQVTGSLTKGDQVVTGDTLILKTEAQRGALGGGHSH